MTGKFVPSEKKNCRTSDWKILVPSEKRRAEHVTGKFWCRQKKTTAEHKADACTKISGMMHVRKFWCCQKKRTAKHVTGKFWCCRKKQLQNTWLENVGAVEKKNCKTRDWKILVLSEKTTAEHVAGKCWCRRKKKNCKTCDWKILVPSQKKDTWLENLCRQKTLEHVAEKVTCLWEKYLSSTKPNRKLLHNVYQL